MNLSDRIAATTDRAYYPLYREACREADRAARRAARRGIVGWSYSWTVTYPDGRRVDGKY